MTLDEPSAADRSQVESDSSGMRTGREDRCITDAIVSEAEGALQSLKDKLSEQEAQAAASGSLEVALAAGQ